LEKPLKIRKPYFLPGYTSMAKNPGERVEVKEKF
jgi:hypothetical protein